MKNKKGFTLVELLAVIVILALIMGIAVVSMSGVISSSRSKTYQESAASIISGLRQRLLLDNTTNLTGTYQVTKGILESGGEKSPYGKDFNWGTCSNAVYCTYNKQTTDCGKTSPAFVEVVTGTDGKTTYKICLSDTDHYVYAEESTLLQTNATIN